MGYSYSELIKGYLQTFLECDCAKGKEINRIANNLYDSMYQGYDVLEERKDSRQCMKICQLIDKKVLPKLDKAIMYNMKTAEAEEMLKIRKLFFAMSARRILKNFAFYIEQYNTKKVWAKTYKTMESLFYYMDRFMQSETLNLLRGSLMPSMGKSYLANMTVAQGVGNNPNLQILRITYSDDLCVTSTRQTCGIINSRAYREIFPRYEKYKGEKIFKTKTSYQFCMCDCEDEYNLNASTRNGQATGLRCQLLIIDDLLKDDSESYNKDLHKQMENRYDSTWTSRADDDSLKVLLLGTMWADSDLLNVIYDRETETKAFHFDKKHRFTECADDGSSVFIGIPALDENEESTCPLRYSTEKLLKIRKTMDKYLWQCVYQQQPIAPDGLEFDYGTLRTYSSLPDEKTIIEERIATLDPNRKGIDYVSMPIFYKFAGDDLYYIVDWLYKKKSIKELYDDIADTIVRHRLLYLHLENNTDTSLKTVLEAKLAERGYFACTISEVYSIGNKANRINMHQGEIKNNIKYPKKGLFSNQTDIGKAMNNLTSYSFSRPNKHDDAIDSVCMFCMKFIQEKYEFPTVGSFNRRELGF